MRCVALKVMATMLVAAMLMPTVLMPTVLMPTVSAQDDRVLERIESILVEYELIRDALANDRGEPVAAVARRLQSKATDASREASGATRSQLRAIASKARALAAVDADDLQALRLAFGRVSEPLVTIVRASARLQRGRHLFDCPMAEGYGGWIQNDEQIANPYMGRRMLTCGAARDW